MKIVFIFTNTTSHCCAVVTFYLFTVFRNNANDAFDICEISENRSAKFVALIFTIILEYIASEIPLKEVVCLIYF